MAGKSRTKDQSYIELGYPEADCDTLFFAIVMRNLELIDKALAGAEGYDTVNVPLLVDSLIGKVLNSEKKMELRALKKRRVKQYLTELEENTRGSLDKTERNQAILDANMDVYGDIVEFYAKYLSIEKTLKIGIS